eukprot:s149_g10.t1
MKGFGMLWSCPKLPFLPKSMGLAAVRKKPSRRHLRLRDGRVFCLVHFCSLLWPSPVSLRSPVLPHLAWDLAWQPWGVQDPRGSE